MSIKILGKRFHQKAQEAYISVIFTYGSIKVEWDIPIEYRRTGTHLLDQPESAIKEYIEDVYDDCNPSKWATWKKEQTAFWANKPNAATTRGFFDVLMQDFQWKSVETDLPKNPNWARRIQDIKEFGYTLATDTNRLDRKLKTKCTHILLLPLSRGGITGYEIWSKELRDKIVSTLSSYDAYEAKPGKKEGLLPDHKFPEIRWDQDTKRDDLTGLTLVEIKKDFQLLSNQRNQQKREVCRACYQTGQRGQIYGVSFFYKGTSEWPSNIPKRGKAAEKGCEGCGWYDIQKWRDSLNQFVSGKK